MEQSSIEFQTGPYGEVYPIPLTTGIDPDDALKALTDASAAMGSPVDVPTRGKSLGGMYNLGMLYVHQLRLREALAGELSLPEAEALRRTVMVDRQPMSLRPLMMERLEYGFAPILTYLGDDRWRVGAGDRSVTFEESDPARAVARAQQLFTTWADADDERWQAAVEKVMARYPRSLFHDYWAHYTRHHDEGWERGAGFHLQLLGRHNTFQLTTPKGSRVFTTSCLRAAHITDAIARHAGVQPDYPPSPVVMEWLTVEGLPLPHMTDEVGDRWQVGAIRVRRLRDKHVILLEDAGGDRYVIRHEGRRPKELVLRPLVDGEADESKMLAHTVVEPPLKEWMKDMGRTVLTMWFIWKIKLGAE